MESSRKNITKEFQLPTTFKRKPVLFVELDKQVRKKRKKTKQNKINQKQKQKTKQNKTTKQTNKQKRNIVLFLKEPHTKNTQLFCKSG